ncbi:hypothetical protein MMC11_004846 [Xylographa trunciseda]|nr:hypothetical protein [Xylographa trunciseda]
MYEKHGTAQARIPLETSRSTYIPLSSVSGWYDYHVRVANRPLIRRFARPDFTLDLTLSGQTLEPGGAENLTAFWTFLRFGSETSTMPLTVLSALERGLPNLTSKDRLVIHVLGTSMREYSNMMVFEEIFHLLPTLNHLQLVLVGPKSPSANLEKPEGIGEPIALDCCPACTSRGRGRSMTSYRGVYHEYAKTSQYHPPDLAVLFHSGRSQAEEASWAPTTRLLVASNILTLCTTYTEIEAAEEVDELCRLQAHMVLQPEINKWHSLVPYPDMGADVEHVPYYLNYYWYMFGGRGNGAS